MIKLFELAIIGSGPAGMEAAISATENGVNTVIIDHFPKAGGQYFMQLPEKFSSLAETETEIKGRHLIKKFLSQKVTQIQGALIWGIFKDENEEDWLIGLFGPSVPKFVRAKKIILANGAYDTPVAFPGWTLPGVITCGAALIFLKSQRFAPGTKAIVSGTGPLLLSVGAHLIEAGVEVLAICESNQILPKGFLHGLTMFSHLHRVKEGAKYFSTILKNRVSYKTGWSVKEVKGQNRVEEVSITKLDRNGRPIPGKQITHKADLVISGYSLTPNTGLARMIGCEFKYQANKGGWIPHRNERMQSSIPEIYIIGDGASIGGAENAQLEGKIAGIDVAFQTGHLNQEIAQRKISDLQPQLKNQKRFGVLYSDLFTPKPGLISLANDETILCRCEEVTFGEVKKAVEMGAKTIGEVKMLTRAGMGNCQGRMCEHSISNAIVEALSSEFDNREMIGFNSIRPPLHPLPAIYLAEARDEIDPTNNSDFPQ